MRGHALRGMVTAWLGLIVLQTVGSAGSGRVAGAFADVNRLLKRALDPSVPAIPDRRAGGAGGYWTPSGGPFTPAPSGIALPGAHPGAQINPSTGAVVGYGY